MVHIFVDIAGTHALHHDEGKRIGGVGQIAQFEVAGLVVVNVGHGHGAIPETNVEAVQRCVELRQHGIGTLREVVASGVVGGTEHEGLSRIAVGIGEAQGVESRRHHVGLRPCRRVARHVGELPAGRQVMGEGRILSGLYRGIVGVAPRHVHVVEPLHVGQRRPTVRRQPHQRVGPAHGGRTLRLDVDVVVGAWRQTRYLCHGAVGRVIVAASPARRKSMFAIA